MRRRNELQAIIEVMKDPQKLKKWEGGIPRVCVLILLGGGIRHGKNLMGGNCWRARKRMCRISISGSDLV